MRLIELQPLLTETFNCTQFEEGVEPITYSILRHTQGSDHPIRIHHIL